MLWSISLSFLKFFQALGIITKQSCKNEYIFCKQNAHLIYFSYLVERPKIIFLGTWNFHHNINNVFDEFGLK